MALFEELKRRNVFRVATAYLVVGWLLTEVLTTILPTLGAPDWIADAVILVFAFGFIPAVIFSWIYELTPEGVKREEEIERDESITPRTAKKLDYVTVAAVIALVFFFALFSARKATDVEEVLAPAVNSASVAVLPFINMSNDEDNEYFSDGLTETLLHMLAQIPDLKVAARTSSFAFKDQNKTIDEIATTLEVAHVLEGSVQRVGDRVRITAQLIRASDGFHVWSESYDRTLDDIFGIQDEIAERVGGALSASLLGTAPGNAIAGVNTKSADAYDLYLQALRERATFSYGGLQASEDLLKGALTIDPDFLEAKTALANNYFAQVETGLMEFPDAYSEIMAITAQVIEVRPADIGARAARLYAQALMRGQAGDADALFEGVENLESLIDEDPSELQVRFLLSRLYQGIQQDEQAIEVLLGALKRDPLNPRILFELGSLYDNTDQPEEARKILKKSLEVEPSQPNAYVRLGGLSLQEGDGVGFIQQSLKAMTVDPQDHELPGVIAQFLYQLDLIEEADDFRNRVMAIAPTSEIAYRAELLRALNTGDEVSSVASARRAIEDDVEDRYGSFTGAVQHLLRVAARDGTVAEESAYLESRAPGILDVNAETTPIKYRFSQFAAFDAWYTILSKEELQSRMDSMVTFAESYGLKLEDSPETEMAVLAMLGRTEAAIDIALSGVFSQPVATNLGWERGFAQAQYTDMVADPRIQEAMQRWEEEEAALRDQVRTYLADLYAST